MLILIFDSCLRSYSVEMFRSAEHSEKHTVYFFDNKEFL